MAHYKRPINFVLFGYYGFGNFGDELLCASVASELLRLGYKADTLRILVGGDVSTAKSLGITPLFRRNIFANTKVFLKTRVFLFGGGGIFQDENGISSCLYYLFYEIVAKACGCKVYMIGQSIGPLNTRCGSCITKIAFKLANKVTVRDKQSKGYLDNHSISCYLHSDLVLLLNNFVRQNAIIDTAKKNLVLFNVRDRYMQFSELAARKAIEFTLQHDLQLRYIAFSSGDITEFERLVEIGLLPKLPIILVKNMDQFKFEVQSAKFALGMRLHFGILSSALGLSILLCPYNPKVRGFAEEYNLPLLENDNQLATFGKIAQEDLNRLTTEKVLLDDIFAEIK